MGSKPKAQTTQTNKVELSPEQKQIADLAFPFAQQYAQQTLNLPAPNVMGFNPTEVEGQNAVLANARGAMNDQMQTAAAQNQAIMGYGTMNPADIPFLGQAADVIMQKQNQNLMESVLPALRSGTVVTGGFNSGGNTRQGIAQGQAVQRTADSTNQALTSLYHDAWKTALGASGAAIDRSGAVGTNLLKPGTAISGVGTAQRELDQQQSNANTEYAWMQQMLPYMQAQQIYGLINGMPGGTGVSTVTGAQPQSGGIGGALGGAMSGAAMGSMFPGIGTVMGGLLGGIGGFFS